MSTFQLTSNGTPYDLDTAGNVSQNGNSIGQWTTDGSNNIIVTSNAIGVTSSDLPVFNGLTWQFNNNQLCLSSGGAQVINFDTPSDGTTVDYSVTETAALQVVLMGAGEQSFLLTGTWDFDLSNTLSLTISGTTSQFASGGLIARVTNGFAYSFSDNIDGNIPYVLSFKGKWGQSPTDSTKLTFTYQTSSGPATFTLPGSLSFNRSTNQLQYSYTDNGGVSWGVSFTGALVINENWTISYSIDESSQNGIQTSTIVINTVINVSRFSGDLELKIVDSNGKAGDSITFGGQFQAFPGDVTLNVGFSINQTSGQPLNLAFNGDLITKSGVDLSFSFSKNAAGETIAFDVSQFKLGPFDASAQFKLTDDNGKNWAVQGLLNWSF